MSRALAADLVLALHVLFVAFVVLGLVLIVIGGVRAWGWVRHRRFRQLHLAAIGFVVVETWLGRICPLTSLEASLREGAAGGRYESGFLAHWLSRLLYVDAPVWAFLVAYTAFGAAVVAAWFLVPPRARVSARSPSDDLALVTPASETTTPDLLRLSRDLIESFRARDRGAMERILADDFRHVDASGTGVDRERFVRAMVESPWRIRTIGFERIEVHEIDGFAVVTGIQAAEVELPDGTVATSRGAFTDLFTRVDGRWRLRLAHSTEL
jgi:ketosteroid isomerase-like protein